MAQCYSLADYEENIMKRKLPKIDNDRDEC